MLFYKIIFRMHCGYGSKLLFIVDTLLKIEIARRFLKIAFFYLYANTSLNHRSSLIVLGCLVIYPICIIKKRTLADRRSNFN